MIVSSTQAKLLLAAHRGDSASRPENTLAAFSSAKTVADFVEFDVRITVDGGWIVMHDESVDRTTTGAGMVANQSLDSLLALDAGKRFNASFTGQTVPSAEAALAEIVTDAAPMMEFKSGTVAEAVALLARVPWRSDGYVIHFSLDWLIALKRQRPDLRVGWLGSGEISETRVELARSSGIEMISWRHDDLNEASVRSVQQRGLVLFAWTVNDRGRCEELRRLGVDGIVGDGATSMAKWADFASPLANETNDADKPLDGDADQFVVLDSGAFARGRRKVTWTRADSDLPIGQGGALAWRLPASGRTDEVRARWLGVDGVQRSRRFSLQGAKSEGGLSNLSARAFAGTGDATAIVGWVTEGAAQPRVLIRGVGPALTSFGVGGVLRNPHVRIFRDNAVVSDVGGGGRADVTASSLVESAAGAFPLPSGSADAVFWGALPGGAMTAHLSGAANETGVGLLEIYRDPLIERSQAGRLVNLSFRGQCPVGGNLIAGFVIEGTGSQLILLRGVGPGLRPLGLTHVLSDPWLRLVDAKGNVLASSDDWSFDDDQGLIAQAMEATGSAWLLQPGGRDAALLLHLPAGAYTAVMESVDPRADGVGLIEVFHLGSIPTGGSSN